MGGLQRSPKMDIELPDSLQRRSATQKRLALLLAEGASVGRITSLVQKEDLTKDEQDRFLKDVLLEGRQLIAAQKRRYIQIGATWFMVGLVPFAAALILTKGVLWIFTMVPMAYGVYLMTRRGNDSTEFDNLT